MALFAIGAVYMFGLGWLCSWWVVPAANQFGGEALSGLIGFIGALSVTLGAFIVAIGAALTASVIAPIAGGTTSYSNNTLGSGDATDRFRVNAAAGQVLSVTLTVLDFGSGSSLLMNLKDQGGTLLMSDSVARPATVSEVLSWMSNNTTPSAHLLEIRASPGQRCHCATSSMYRWGNRLTEARQATPATRLTRPELCGCPLRRR